MVITFAVIGISNIATHFLKYMSKKVRKSSEKLHMVDAEVQTDIRANTVSEGLLALEQVPLLQSRVNELTAASSQGHPAADMGDRPIFTNEFMRLTEDDLRLLVYDNMGITVRADETKAVMVGMLRTLEGYVTDPQIRYLRDLIRKKEGGPVRPFIVEEVRNRTSVSVAIDSFKQLPDRRLR